MTTQLIVFHGWGRGFSSQSSKPAILFKQVTKKALPSAATFPEMYPTLLSTVRNHRSVFTVCICRDLNYLAYHAGKLKYRARKLPRGGV